MSIKSVTGHIVYLFYLLLFLTVFSIGFLVYFFDGITGGVANKIYANAKLPIAFVRPLTAYAIPNSGEDVQALGGMGLGLSCSIPSYANWLAFRKMKQSDRASISLQMR